MSMSSSIPSSLSQTLSLIQQKTSFGFALLFLIFGVTGCFLNILLFSRRQFRSVSCSAYFLASSVVMFIQLSFSACTSLYASYYDFSIIYSISFCKLWFYILNSTSIMSRWILSAACLDRYALSSRNIRLRNLANVQTAHRVIFLIILIALIFPIHILVLYDIKSRNCNIFNNYIGSVYNVIVLMINTGIIPLIVMISCTLLIRKNLLEKQKRRQILENQPVHTMNHEDEVRRKRDQQALRMLFAQVIIFVVIITP
ncbi:unnamed protein product [Adineta ricciae]|uniref:G-protein coupled receptors family 1 profile domain-containing protein n=1 Tax=Adineta ricciae TaxID=249248 RepID=A0A815J5K6_ADIRI|nr:unnamed protein product [Adineta ricciae]